MTDFDRRSFMGSLAALFGAFRIKGAPEHELVKATDDFLEDPDCEEEETSSSEVTSCSCAFGCVPGYDSSVSGSRKHCPDFPGHSRLRMGRQTAQSFYPADWVKPTYREDNS